MCALVYHDLEASVCRGMPLARTAEATVRNLLRPSSLPLSGPFQCISVRACCLLWTFCPLSLPGLLSLPSFPLTRRTCRGGRWLGLGTGTSQQTTGRTSGSSSHATQRCEGAPRGDASGPAVATMSCRRCAALSRHCLTTVRSAPGHGEGSGGREATFLDHALRDGARPPPPHHRSPHPSFAEACAALPRQPSAV